jgi:long-subunit fatty acid transport protein
MAGTLTATCSGYESVYYNPAALAFEKRPSFSIGFQWAAFNLNIDSAQVDVPSAPALLLGFGIPLPLVGVLRDRLTIGMGFVLPSTSVLSADIPRPGSPRFVLLEARAQTVSIMGALGVRVLEELAVGAGVIALSELIGAIDVEPNQAGNIGASVEDELRATYALIAGAMWRPSRESSVGLVFRDQSDAAFDIPITADLGEDFPLPIPLLDISGTAQFDPRQVALAGALRVGDDLTLAISASYKFWSEFENPIVFTASAVGDPAQPSANFSNVLAARAGGEVRVEVGDWLLLPRFGAGFEPSPVPDQTGFHNYLDNARVLVSGGLGARRERLSLSLSTQTQVLLSRTEHKNLSQLDRTSATPPKTSISHDGWLYGFVLEASLEL